MNKNLLLEIIKKPILIFYVMDIKGIIHLPDKIYLKLLYKYKIGKKIDFNNPRTFNEKLQWLKIYDRNPNYTKMVDKYEAKKYVAQIIGEEYIIPTIGIYDKFEDINFKELPNKFVIKCTHDSGGLIICKDKNKLDIKKAKDKINECLKRNYFYCGREWPYKNVRPKIIIEKYMEDETKEDLKDYKFFCFNDKVKIFKIDFNRFNNHQANYYDRNGEFLDFGELVCPRDKNKKIKLPENLSKMIELAEILSKNISFLRVDFYEINDKVYFGELTFYPASGFGEFTPEEYDRILGDWLELPKEKRVKNEK